MPSDWQAQISRYIDLVLEVGLNLRRGQRLLVIGSFLRGLDVALAPFVRQLAQSAYAHGASFVDVVWGDPQLERLRVEQAPAESLMRYPAWPAAARLEYFKSGDAVLAVHADDPDLLAGIDPALVAAHLNGIRAHLKPLMSYLSSNVTNWCVVGVPSAGWASRVLPDLPAAQRDARLWDLIFSACRLGEPDPVESWRQHVHELSNRATFLTARQYTSLVYAGPGTHLTVGLPPGHIWNGGSMVAGNDISFVANLPTEEVFTLPHRLAVEGQVTATRPFNYGGNIVDGMTLTFAGGKVTHFAARQGQGILRELLQTDEGSDRLGEAAIVPNSSPVSRLGVTFHNILFDENASCHLAFGDAYRFSLKAADSLTDEEFAVQGGNHSHVHTDFMIGSGELDIDGTLPGGSAEPILRGGEWAFDV